MKFHEFNLDEQILEAISYMGFEEATPIQEQTIPQALAGRDILGLAQTGTGKTAAFLLPILNKLVKHTTNGVNTLIIAPTRELAIQIEREIQGFTYFVPINSMAVYGGGSGIEFSEQKAALSKGTDIIVATPGKLISHLNMGYVNFNNLQHLVLDEADRMLDMGFSDDILKIISYLPKKRQTLLFSATMPAKIKTFAQSILNDPFEVKIAISKPAEGVIQAAYMTYESQKIPFVVDFIKDKNEYKSILIFSSTKRKVFEIVKSLQRNKIDVEGISSDLEQAEREAVLSRFRSKQVRVLVGTDVVSRGIDIKDINLVINFDVPGDAEDYVHRIGRTARAETTGVAVTLVSEKDMENLGRIEELIEKEIPKVALPAELGEGPAYNPKPARRKWGTKPNANGHSKPAGSKPSSAGGNPATSASKHNPNRKKRFKKRPPKAE
jgi:superfamily II DNA/RNA helicase